MQSEVFLTFDIDWACDDVINATLDILEERSIGATFFATHKSPVLSRIRNNTLMELGIHPNFNKALSGEENKSYLQIIDEILQVVPGAISERAHALTQNSLISLELKQRGIMYDLNVYIPLSANIAIKPFFAPSGILTVPFFFEDDVYFFPVPRLEHSVEDYFAANCIKVFNFHPIHVFLNSNTRDVYERAKKLLNSDSSTFALMKLKNTEKFGAGDFLLNIIDFGKKHSFKFKTINEIQGV
jgi:peptidoglycan/xylan/chitin deacetylase (PgdA/CDA1 family)